jgi:hypothetical protein
MFFLFINIIKKKKLKTSNDSYFKYTYKSFNGIKTFFKQQKYKKKFIFKKKVVSDQIKTPIEMEETQTNLNLIKKTCKFFIDTSFIDKSNSGGRVSLIANLLFNKIIENYNQKYKNLLDTKHNFLFLIT